MLFRASLAFSIFLTFLPFIQAQYSFLGPWRSNQPAAGEVAGVVYANANASAIGPGGNGVMLGSVSGTGITGSNDDAIFASVAGSVFKVARTTDAVPGLTNVAYGDLNGKWPLYNGSSILFYSALTGTGTTTADNEAFFYGSPSNLQILARKGDLVTGLTNVNFSLGSQTVRMNAGGTASFVTSLTGSGTSGSTNQGIAIGTPGNLSIAVRKGDNAPGIAGTTITGFDTSALTINGNGDLGYQTVLSGSSTINNALWIKPNGQTAQLLVRKGDAVPGVAGTTFSNLTSGNLVINNNRFAAFRADIAGVPSNVSGIWAGLPGNVQYVARQSDPTPLAGVTYSTLNSPLLMNNNKLAFYSTVAGSGIDANNNQAIWYGDPGSLQLLIRTGDAAGSTGLFFHVIYQSLHARADGSVIFAAQLGTTPAGGTLKDSLWIASPSGLSLVVSQGDSVALGPDYGMQTVGSIRLISSNDSGAEDGYIRSVADDGSFGAEIGFPGFSTGVIITTAVPEVSTVVSVCGALVGVAFAVLWHRRQGARKLAEELVSE